ncbi:cytochrome P450 81Q32-like [Typha angustifolia]|uniref:cytochrome P450 81Q32-like n=1 Tax=Typha angustifolia TaxID=59011 RepID=UPI003C2CE6FB
MEISFSYLNILLSFAALFLIKLFVFTYNNRKKKKKLPPSPPALPFIGHLYLFKNPLHHTLARISARYGPITFLRFGSRPVVVVNSGAVAEECFTTHDLAFANRVQLPSKKQIASNYANIGTANYGSHWRNIRRIASVELLSTHRLLLSSSARTDEVRHMARGLLLNWKKIAGSQGSTFVKVEMKSRLFELSLNVMMRIMAGKRYFGEAAEGSEDARQFREVVEEIFGRGGATTLSDFLPILGLFQGVNKAMKRLNAVIDDFSQRLVDEHKKENKDNQGERKKKTMIDHLLSLRETEPDSYSDQTIKSICMSLLMAGTDTTSNTVEWAMSLLLNNPHTLIKAVAEIETHVGNERLIDESNLSNLPYLHYILKETLRLYPGGPLLVPHESRDDIVLNNYDIPRGTMLLVNAYSIHRDPATWDEPDEFRPERFMEKKGGEKYMIAFGNGRRRCPGEALAIREVGIMLGTLLQCFEWRRVGDEAVDLGEGSGLTLPKAVALEAIYMPRENMERVLAAEDLD